MVSLLLGVVVASGCSASVSGKIDEEDVPSLFSAFFVQDKNDNFIDPLDGSTVTLFTAAGSGVSLFDGCSGQAKRQDAINTAFDDQTKDLRNAGTDVEAIKAANEKHVDALVDYDKKNLPSDYWVASVSIAGFKQDDLATANADIDVKDPDNKANFFGAVSVCRVDDFPEKKVDADGVATEVIHQSCFAARKGTVTVKSYTADKTLDISGDVDFSRVEADGINPDDDSGAATVTISAGWCEDLENFLDDAKKLEEDRTAAP
jgi:hypothetical protein